VVVLINRMSTFFLSGLYSGAVNRRYPDQLTSDYDAIASGKRVKPIGTLRPFDFAQDSSSTAFSSEPVEESGRADKYLDSNKAIPFVVSLVYPEAARRIEP
jgi:hypothetical protein